MGLAALFAACENNENEGPEGPEPREQVGRTVSVSYTHLTLPTIRLV